VLTDPAADPSTPGVAALQRRTVATLVGSQVLGGVGLATGFAVGSILAEEISGSAKFAGLGGTFQVLGGALIAIPMAALMARSGRRPGLLLGYALACLGAIGIVLSGVVGSFALLLVASALFGGGAAANSQARFAAADLAEPRHRGRDLSMVVWATTIGSVLGPNLVGPSEPMARALGIPVLTGPFVLSLVGFALGGLLLAVLLRPDPLLTARQVRGELTTARGSVLHGLRAVRRHPGAVLGLTTMTVGHVVMVSVMVMTPLHMHHGGAALELIGFVISVHVLGMFAFSPLTGLAVDRWGGRRVALAGAAVQVAAGLLAATTPTGASTSLTVALFLLGLGWSGTLVSGSTLLVDALSVSDRASSQGAADLSMGLVAATGGALAGVVIDVAGYDVLGLGAAVLALAVPVTAVLTRDAAHWTDGPEDRNH